LESEAIMRYAIVTVHRDRGSEVRNIKKIDVYIKKLVCWRKALFSVTHCFIGKILPDTRKLLHTIHDL